MVFHMGWELISCIIITVIVLFYTILRLMNENVNITPLCDAPSCIRCNANTKVKRKAKIIFIWKYIWRYRKYHYIKESLFNGNDQYIIYLESLQAKPYWCYDDLNQEYQNDIYLILSNIHVFYKDFDNLSAKLNAGINPWSKVFLVEQGHKYDGNIVECADTYKILLQCSNVLQNCLFGFIFFSQLKPNTIIEAHKGPTNCRLRCHVPLVIPKLNFNTKCSLKVNNIEKSWKLNEALMFDDSFEHSVVYNSQPLDNVNRVVLIIDFWHPDLTKEDRCCLQNCFSTL